MYEEEIHFGIFFT